GRSRCRGRANHDHGEYFDEGHRRREPPVAGMRDEDQSPRIYPEMRGCFGPELGEADCGRPGALRGGSREEGEEEGEGGGDEVGAAPAESVGEQLAEGRMHGQIAVDPGSSELGGRPELAQEGSLPRAERGGSDGEGGRHAPHIRTYVRL